MGHRNLVLLLLLRNLNLLLRRRSLGRRRHEVFANQAQISYILAVDAEVVQDIPRLGEEDYI